MNTTYDKKILHTTNNPEKFITIQLNKAIHGYQKGTYVKVRVDKNNVPLERRWRDRFKDVVIDNSFTIVPKEDKKAGGKNGRSN